MTEKDWLGNENTLGIDVIRNKYFDEGEVFIDFMERVSLGDKRYYDIIINKKFMPAGRVLANIGLLGNGKRTTSNCYVLKIKDDSLESIFECGKEMARTYSAGGGVGIDLGVLAPRGAKVNNAARTSSGAVSFMDFYSMITGLIAQHGRRGALMLSMPCDHPDIEEFVDVKTDLDRVTKANTSVRMFDDFMVAVNEGGKYELRFHREETGEDIIKTIDAKQLFRKIAQNNWDMGEPGMLFWDTIDNNRIQPDEDSMPAGVNPCAEEPLIDYGACLLGSINLAAFVTPEGWFDMAAFEDTVALAVEYLNDVLDKGAGFHPLAEQSIVANDWRQIGLGIMGLADMLIKMKCRYGSTESLRICDEIGHHMVNAALRASALLTEKYGKYSKYDEDIVLTSEFIHRNADDETIKLIAEHGLANSQLLTIPPCGSIATMLGISSGIEPIFANYYTRKTESLKGEDTYYKVYTPIVKRYMDEHGIEDDSQLPDFFVTAHDIDWKVRVNMQSVWQAHIDASISSTVNLPEHTTVEEVEQLYNYAWQRGLKGITVFRDNCKRVGVLTTGAPKAEEQQAEEPQYDHIVPVSRSEFGTTHGSTYLKRCACGKLYITVNRDEAGNVVETFVNTSKGGICQANSNAVNRLISLAMRSGVKVDEIVDQLSGISCPACVRAISKGKEIDGLSCPDIIAKVIKDFYNCEQPVPVTSNTPVEMSVAEQYEPDENHCPDCGAELMHTGGCIQCTSCPWSKCG